MADDLSNVDCLRQERTRKQQQYRKRTNGLFKKAETLHQISGGAVDISVTVEYQGRYEVWRSKPGDVWPLGIAELRRLNKSQRTKILRRDLAPDRPRAPQRQRRAHRSPCTELITTEIPGMPAIASQEMASMSSSFIGGFQMDDALTMPWSMGLSTGFNQQCWPQGQFY